DGCAAARSAGDLQPTVQPFDSAAHAGQTDASVRSLGIEASACVDDGERNVITGGAERDASTACTRVAGDVAERFLRYAVQALGSVVREIARHVPGLELHVELTDT